MRSRMSSLGLARIWNCRDDDEDEDDAVTDSSTAE